MERATLRRLAIGIVLALVIGVGFFVHPPTAQADSAVIEATGIDETLYDLSDDGRYVAYVKLRNSGDDPTGLVWYDMQSGTRRWLFQGDVGDAGAVRITADNRTVLWVQNLRFPNPNSATMTRVDVATGQSTTLFTSQETIGIENAVSSANGQFIAFFTENLYTHNSIWVFDIQTRILTEASRHTTTAVIQSLNITPDGNTVVAHIVSNGNHTIHAIPRTGDAPIILSTPTTTPIENVTLTPDGSAVYYFLAASTYSQLYRAPLSGEAAVAIGEGGLAHGSLQFSPDGLYGFYPHYVNGQGTVFRLTLADQSLAILHSTTIYFATDEHLAITVVPTGNRILIAEANNGNSDNSIRLLNVGYAPIEPARLLTTEYGVNNSINGELRERRIPLIITPDGAHVVYTQPSGTAFYLKRVALEGSTLPVRLYPDPLVRDVLLSRSGAGLFFNVKTLPSGGIDDLYYLDFFDLNPNLLYRGQTHPIHLLDPALDNDILFTAPLPPIPGFNPTISLRRAGLIATAYLNYSELATIAEGSSRSITVDFYPSSADTVTVTYSAISGTATLGDDFTLSPTPLVFAPGQVSQTLTITALADTSIEGLETATLQFQNQQTGVTALLTLSFNEMVAVSNAPAHLGATTDDGRRVVFQETHGDRVGLYSKDLATGTRYELLAPDDVLSIGNAVALSPDGSTVLYRSGSGMFQVPFTGGVSTPLLNGICDPIITFTTDSQHAQLLNSCAEGVDPVYSIDLTTATTNTLLSNAVLSGIPLAVSPDGNTVLYQQLNGGGGVEALHVVPATGGMPRFLNQIIFYAAFDSPTTFLYVQYLDPNLVLTRFDVMTGSSTPVISLPDYAEGVHFSSERQTLYYRTPGNSLSRYKLGALNADSMGGRAVTAWLQPVADETQFLYYQEYTECHRYGCDVVSGDVGTVSSAGDQWRSNRPALYTQVSPDGRALVYGEWNVGTTKLYQKSLLPMGAEREVTAFPLVPNNLDAWRTGDNRIFAVVGATLQSTALYENTPAVTHFRNSHIPTLHTASQNPKTLTLFAGDLLYFQDADGYLYALSEVAPAINSTNAEQLVAEGDTVTVTVSLASTPLITATVAVNIVGGTATVGTDVSAPPATLTFAPFQREQTFTLTVAADGSAEAIEDVRLTFTPVSGASAGTQNTYRLRIADRLYRRQLPLMQQIK